MRRTIPDCAKLPPDERAACYREFAVEAGQLAGNAVNAANRRAYSLIAAQWRAMADDLDEGSEPPITRPRNRFSSGRSPS